MRTSNRLAQLVSRSGTVALVLVAGGFVWWSPLTAHSADEPTVLKLDARDVTRRILHSKLHIPAQPGPLTLVYPKWIPGEHGPTGPISDMVGLEISASGAPISWRRDAEDNYAIHIDVP